MGKETVTIHKGIKPLVITTNNQEVLKTVKGDRCLTDTIVFDRANSIVNGLKFTPEETHSLLDALK